MGVRDQLQATVDSLVQAGKGILAADESAPTSAPERRGTRGAVRRRDGGQRSEAAREMIQTQTDHMQILVNGVNLFFDVEGIGLCPVGTAMVRKPTLLLLHRGPGVDHSLYKPAFSSLAPVAQVVDLDHRADGRSDHAEEEAWKLAPWADDVHDFCESLGIEKPIVYGASFGYSVSDTLPSRLAVVAFGYRLSK